MEDDESLAEAVLSEEEAAEAAGVVPLPGSVGFEMKSRSVDLFAGSKAAWTLMALGVALKAAKTSSAGGYTVCTTNQGGKWVRTEYQAMDIGMAMAWGEAVAEDTGSFSVAKSARWRWLPPSDAQASLARSLGLAGAEHMSRGDLSEALGVHFASKKFDRHIGSVYC